ncbi:MAG: zinc-ribbon domain-containing protein [Pseudomonadales bacterium]|jgi:predicted Zn finger-like uncharacterized protein|nr:zinc-ribbon domain-containing protein [Pseudomonadales bacterium]
MSEAVTRCPGCQTAFRVNAEQLASAEGLVRCGVCARVFRADLHLVANEPVPGWQAGQPAVPGAAIEEIYIRELLGEHDHAEQPAPIVVGHHAPDPGEGVAKPHETCGDAPASEGVCRRDATPEPAAAAVPEPATGSDTPIGAETVDATDEPAAAAEPAPVPPFTPPPIEIDQTPAPRRARNAAWGLGCAVAMLALAVQYGWHQRTRLLEDPATRHGLERACATFGCALPRPPAPQAIRGEALLVRPAPDREGVLLVDALLSNHAAYAQPWPGLAISFQDLRGHTLAGRVFAAAEYLPEPPRVDMPIGQAVAVHLELHDPGERATGYRMEILPPAAAR